MSNLLVQRDERDLPIDIRLVISSSSKVRGVEIAQNAGIETIVVRKTNDAEAYSKAMFDPVRQSGAKYVVMAGFLKHVLIPRDFDRRVINIHPSLLPDFGGEGMYGHHVHKAVLEKGESVSGCTVHFVDNVYDNGPMILQKQCDVLPGDTVDDLANRVFERECVALPEAIRKLWEQENAGNKG